MVTRFAPSPTGLLHLGHAYAAMFARQIASEHGGRFLLRFEDIDITRVRDEFYLAIEEDLGWLGIEWEGTPLRQQDRLEAYRQSLDKLDELGVLYPCFCTRRDIEEELKTIANAPHGPGTGVDPGLYPGTCRTLSEMERQCRLQAGDSHCWRLDAGAAAKLTGPLQFEDRIKGCQQVDPFLLGDVILARKDIATSYHLAVVTDDAFEQITDVTRGEDLLSSTHVHRTLQSLLGLPTPVYHHHQLLLDERGKRLAKRTEALSLRTLRETGKSPQNVIAMLPPLQ